MTRSRIVISARIGDSRCFHRFKATINRHWTDAAYCLNWMQFNLIYCKILFACKNTQVHWTSIYTRQHCTSSARALERMLLPYNHHVEKCYNFCMRSHRKRIAGVPRTASQTQKCASSASSSNRQNHDSTLLRSNANCSDNGKKRKRKKNR